MFVVKLDKLGNTSDSLTHRLPPSAGPQIKVVTVKFNIITTLQKYSVSLYHVSSIFNKTPVNKHALQSTSFISFGYCSIILLFDHRPFMPKSSALKNNILLGIFSLGGIFKIRILKPLTMLIQIKKQVLVEGSALYWRNLTWWTASLIIDLSVATYHYKIKTLGIINSKYKALLDTRISQSRSIESQIDITASPTIGAGD